MQLPRLYNVYKEMGIVTSFQNMLDNIFIPLFEVTVDPDSHPQLHVFLKQVCSSSTLTFLSKQNFEDDWSLINISKGYFIFLSQVILEKEPTWYFDVFIIGGLQLALTLLGKLQNFCQFIVGYWCWVLAEVDFAVESLVQLSPREIVAYFSKALAKLKETSDYFSVITWTKHMLIPVLHGIHSLGFFRLLGWIWWMMKANLKDGPQNTCPHLNNGLMCSIRLFHTMSITVMQIFTP